MTDRESAIRCLHEIFVRTPEYTEARFFLASLLAPKDPKQAMALLEELLRHRPYHDRARQRLGRLYYAQADIESALKSLEFAVRINPEEPEYWNDVGVVRSAVGKNESALDAFIQARALDEGYLDPLKNGADLYASLGDLRKAVSWLLVAVEKNPDDPEIKERLEKFSSAGIHQ